MAKWHSIEKHPGKRKRLITKWYMDPKCEHAKNEFAHVQLQVLKHWFDGADCERAKRIYHEKSLKFL